MPHRTTAVLDAGLDEIRRAPRDAGTIVMITRRPAVAEREVLDEAQLDTTAGLVGDRWVPKPSRNPPDGTQLTLMNVRVIRLIADESDWPLAGDQLYVDLDLSGENVPPGTRLAIGKALLEVTTYPHAGCAKFEKRFGSAVNSWVNSPTGRALNLRGINTRVLEPGLIKRGDSIRKL